MTFLLLLTLCLPLYAVPSVDPSLLLYDYAQLLSGEEESKLQKELQRIGEQYGMDAVVVLIDDNEGYTSANYAFDFYDYNGFAEDGLLMLINMDDREVFLSGSGAAMSYFTDGVIDDMTYDLVDPLAEGDYSGTVQLFVQQMEQVLSRPSQGQSSSVSNSPPIIYEAKPSTMHKTLWGELIGSSVLASGLIGGITVAIMAAMHNKLPNKTKATVSYVTDGQVKLRVNRDRYLHSSVRKTRINRNNNSGASGGSGGRSHSHTTVHHGSSGRAHSGGGRKF